MVSESPLGITGYQGMPLPVDLVPRNTMFCRHRSFSFLFLLQGPERELHPGHPQEGFPWGHRPQEPVSPGGDGHGCHGGVWDQIRWQEASGATGRSLPGLSQQRSLRLSPAGNWTRTRSAASRTGLSVPCGGWRSCKCPGAGWGLQPMSPMRGGDVPGCSLLTEALGGHPQRAVSPWPRGGAKQGSGTAPAGLCSRA